MDEEEIDWDEPGAIPEIGGIGMGGVTGIGAGMGVAGGGVPTALQPGGMRVQQQQGQGQAQAQAQVSGQAQGGTRPSVTGQQPQTQGQPQQQGQQQQQRPLQGVQPLGLASQLRQQTSREQLSPADGSGPAQGRNTPSSPNDTKTFDPEDITETKRINATPQVAQDVAQVSSSPVNAGKSPGGPQLPSEILQQQRQEQERAQSELAEHSRRMQQQQLGQQQQRGRDGKLSKQANNSPTSTNTTQSTSEDEKDKKKRGVFGSLFGGRKDKSKDGKAGGKRVNEETPGSAGSGFAQDQRERERDYQGGIGDAPRGPNPNAGQPAKSALSPHARKLQEQDQALYQKYLHSSTKDSPPGPSYATQSMGPYMTGSGSSSLRPNDGSVKARPGSLILTSPGLDGPGVPELNVIRVFAGTNLQTEATFKTVLLNSSTTAADLVRQAMQRFRIPAAEDEGDYFLTVKQQLEGSTTSLQPHENPLVVFEELVEAAELPKVKRSSVGSISSVSSNLSMHPAIKKLSMNDFTDDSTVKFYLNRRVLDGESSERSTPGPAESQQGVGLGKRGELSVSTSGAATVAAERFTSPSTRFAVQVAIYPEDLPDGVVFDTHTEAIVPKSTLKERERAGINPQPSPGIPMNFRRKIFLFPKNTTVAEVIELGLERFGISEGVVDGGDEVEDKLAKRRSQSRVRYGLSVQVEGQGGILFQHRTPRILKPNTETLFADRELFPSSRVVDAFPRPPSFRPVDKSRDVRRRSADINSLLGSVEDVGPNEPVFILRRSVSYRTTNSYRNSLSKGLDELSLYHMQSQRGSVTASETSTNDDRESSAPTPRPQVKPPPAQLSEREIIAAQRAAQKAKQGAILSAQVNSEQGVDILLPDKATLRSVRLATDESIRYSYIEPDGGMYDITDIMGNEWSPQRENSYGRGDLFEAAISKSSNVRQDPSLGEKIDRVLNKIKGNPKLVSSGGRNVESLYLDNDIIVNAPPRPERSPSRNASRSSTPVQLAPQQGHRAQQASITSSASDVSLYDSAPPSSTGARNIPQDSIAEEPEIGKKKPIIVRNNLGISDLLAFIEASAAMKKPVVKDPPPPLSPVDAMLFGPQLDLNELHPLVRDIYRPLVERFDAMDRVSTPVATVG